MKGRGVLVVTIFYRPEANFITADVARRVARHEPVTVVCPHPNYPTGRFYPGTRWWAVRRTVEDGVTVWRVPIFPDHSGSKLRRALHYGSFTAMAALVSAVVAGRPRAVWIYQTPFTAAVAALWFKLAFRSRVVLVCADLWPESFVATGVMRPGPLLNALHALRRVLNRTADVVVGSTRGIVDTFAAEGIARERLRLVRVWIDGAPRGRDLDAPAGSVVPTTTDDGVPTIVYVGNMGPAQGLEVVVRAAAELRRRGAGVRFALYGFGGAEEELKALAGSLGAANVVFGGRIGTAEARARSRAAAAQLVVLRPTPWFRMTVPSKLHFCIGMGTPILCGAEGEAAALARESGGAFHFDPTDPVSLAGAVERVLALEPHERAALRHRLHAFYREHLDPDRLADEHAAILGHPDATPAHANPQTIVHSR
ncbi:MAG TPA: glycosyltransferase family 4 protein [Longimicrobium sp.]|nr:glycosyltransferase family 4 protein [Longimicrobium sp.]